MNINDILDALRQRYGIGEIEAWVTFDLLGLGMGFADQGHLGRYLDSLERVPFTY